jgi:membrane protein DedA with SNARE-associated domain
VVGPPLQRLVPMDRRIGFALMPTSRHCRRSGSPAPPRDTRNPPVCSSRTIAHDGIGFAVCQVMHAPTAYLMQHGVRIVFANVLLQQMGAPIPAEPTLVVAGSLVAKGLLSPAAVVLTTIAAALLADAGWFVLGRRYHAGVLRLLARLSRSKAQQAGRGRSAFARWGLKALLVAKFLPGVSQVMVPIAGATGTTVRSFVLYDIAGTLLWASLPFGGGVIFHQQVDVVLDALFRVGLWVLGGALVVATGLVLSRRVQARRRPA